MKDSKLSFKLKEEIQYINDFCKREGYSKVKETNFGGGESVIYEFETNEGKKCYGKKYNSDDFINPYREFLLEKNIISSFSMEPLDIYIRINEKGEEEFYLMMEIYKSLVNIFHIIRGKAKKSKGQMRFDEYLNILLIIASLHQAVLVLHVQKIPIIHHDLKPANVLLSEYQYNSNKEIEKVVISFENIGKHFQNHMYFTNLIDYGLTKENVSQSFAYGTVQYRSGAHYLESSDLLSMAIILKILIHNFKSNQKDVNTSILRRIDNFVYKRYINNIEKFYYKNTKILKGLDRVINILVNLYYKRRSDIFDILDILTNREKMETIISEDFGESENIRSELINKYFEILELSHITFTYNDEFIKIAPEIFGEKYDYKAFMFTLFHQKNNKFEPENFQSYQEKIVDYKKKSKDKYELFNSIANFHIEINFFSFKQLFTQFSEKFSSTPENNNFTINAKLFKILTSLNFRETRSLNHFSNALHLSLFSRKQEVLYNFLVCFGKDYEAKIGFLLLKSKKDDQDPFEILINRAKFCSENRLYFFKEIDDIADDESADLCNSNINSNDTKQINININFEDDIKFDRITAFELITSNFEDFLENIGFKKSDYKKDECIELFREKISTNKIQNDNLDYLHDYNDDAKFLLFIHYLYYYEVRDENLKLKSISGDSLQSKQNDDDDEEDEGEEWEIEDEKETLDQIMNKYSKNFSLDYELFYSLEDPKHKEIFIWLTLFRLDDLIDDILSQETVKKLQNYIPVVKFLRSTGIDMFEFHIFLDSIFENSWNQFQRIAHIYSLNYKINPVASKIQFLESISYLSNIFLNSIFDKISNENNSNNELLEFISLDKNEKENVKINDYSDIRTKINFPYIIYPFGKINYKNNKSIEELNISDSTLKSKITVCITHALNYLTNLPFKMPIHFELKNILVDEKNGLPIIILGKFDQEYSFDYYNYENVFDCLKKVVKRFYIDMKDNNFLNIIQNYIKISNYENINTSISTVMRGDEIPKSFILFQYIFNLFLDPDSLNLTFEGTDLEEYKRFINTAIKNEFYDDHFQKFAYELLGQSYAVKLDYLFTRMKLGSNLTKEKFVDELNDITSNSSLLTLMDDNKTLADLSNLFERYFIEDSYNLVHRLNQLVEKNYKVLENEIEDDSEYLKYDRKDLNEETISYIYHINNKFVSPMIYSTKENLYFKVSKMKYDLDKIKERFGDDCVRSFCFYYSLKSALSYLINCESKNLLPNELTLDDIYINEMDEVMVLPHTVNESFISDTLDHIARELKINEHSNSIICYSYASYIPLLNQNSDYLMKIFGFDYSTELNEIINSALGFEYSTDDDLHDGNSLNDEKIFKVFNEKCQQAIEENKNNIDKHILELSSDTNKLTPLFIHLLEKAKESKDTKISVDADRRLKIYMSIKEIKKELYNIESKIHSGGESVVSSINYNGKNLAIAQIMPKKQTFLYLQKMKNALYLLKIEDNSNDYVINEIGFTNFGMIMDLYGENLDNYIKNYLMGKPLELFKIILRIIQIICFLHSKNLVHLDIKLNNFLLNSEGKIFVSDMLNVQKESAFSKVTIFTPEYHSDYFKSLLKHQDVFAFETSCWKLFNKNGIFKGYSSPLIEHIEKSKNVKEYEQHYDIERYHQIIISENMYILKDNEGNDEKKKQRRQITKILLHEGELTEDEKEFLDIEKIESKEDFEKTSKIFKKILDKNPDPSKLCFYLTNYAIKLQSLTNEEKNKCSNYYINVIKEIDTFIKNSIDNKEYTDFDLNFKELIYERIYMQENIDINDDDLWLTMKYQMLKYFQDKDFDDDLYKKIKYIISVLDKNKDMNAGFFYYFLLSEKKVSKALEKDIDIKKNAICFFYNYYANIKNKINISDFETLISEIYEFLISHISDKEKGLIGDFKNWLISQNINIISMFFYFYIKYQVQYGALNYVFDDNFYNKVADSDKLRLQSKIEIQPVNTYNFLIEAIEFTKKDGKKLACIYEKYVLHSNDDA